MPNDFTKTLTVNFRYATIAYILLVAIFLLATFAGLQKNNELTLLGLAILSVIITGILTAYGNYSVLVIVFLIALPFSINTAVPGSSSLIIPSEPIAAILAITTISLYMRGKVNREFLYHPVTGLIFIYFISLIISTLFSTMSVVSLKFSIVRLVYLLVFYVLMHLWFKQTEKNKGSFYLLYLAGISCVIIYSLYNHAQFDFSKDTSGLAMQPFYADHTIYSACLAFVIPAAIGYLFNARTFSFNSFIKAVLPILVALLLLAVTFAYCRAAWISLLAAMMFFVLLLFKVQFRTLLVFLSFAAIASALNFNTYLDSFSQNRYDSNRKNATIEDQAKSVTNISSDVSNAERLNRWSCAVRMFLDKPLSGHGPGTYQFQYLPYQLKSEMTRISVTSPYNIDFGKGGSAHSEYLLLLSEAGIFSLLFFIGLALYAMRSGMRVYYNSPNKRSRLLSCFAMLGLVTYLTHGLFNNFLDTDKAALLFWGSISLIVTLDLKYLKSKEYNNN